VETKGVWVGGCCSKEVGPRKPFARDGSGAVDYEAESDLDWEEEPEGESLSVRPLAIPAPL
jgi:Chromatin assembly factor 1 subunit A